jgi:hypothetical protein
MANVKHVGKTRDGSKVIVLWRTVPNETHSCLVAETAKLPGNYHDRLMELVESDEGQQAPELSDLLSRRFFADGSNVLNTLHGNGYIKKVPTNDVFLTPNAKTSVTLSEVNEFLMKDKIKPADMLRKEQSFELPAINSSAETPRDRADKLMAEAARLDTQSEQLKLEAFALAPELKIRRRGRPAKSQ